MCISILHRCYIDSSSESVILIIIEQSTDGLHLPNKCTSRSLIVSLFTDILKNIYREKM